MVWEVDLHLGGALRGGVGDLLAWVLLRFANLVRLASPLAVGVTDRKSVV